MSMRRDFFLLALGPHIRSTKTVAEFFKTHVMLLDFRGKFIKAGRVVVMLQASVLMSWCIMIH